MNSKIPNLETLLKDKTVFILGAGASVDYGFPLWGDLKNQLLAEIEFSKCRVSYPEKSLQYWKDILNSDATEKTTIDELAYAAPEEHYHVIMSLIAMILCKKEQEEYIANIVESKKLGWVEKFSNYLSSLLISELEESLEAFKNSNFLRNLQFVTLNYERCFDYRFDGYVKEALIQKSLSKPERRFFEKYVENSLNLASYGTVYHPHGCIGSLGADEFIKSKPRISYHCYANRSNGIQVPYGDWGRLETHLNQGRRPFLYAVDDLTDSEEETYRKVNKLVLQQSKNIVLVGLSELGLRKSKLDGLNSSEDLDKTRNIYSTGNEIDWPGITLTGLKTEQLIDQIC